MSRQTTAELLAGRHSRIVTAHPDDSIWYASLGAGYADEALLTRGELGRNGTTAKRVAEEAAAISSLGIARLLRYGGNDRRLHTQVENLAHAVAADALRDNVEMLVGNQLPDHNDHLAAGRVAVRAGQIALAQGREMGVLLLRPDDHGAFVAPATVESVERAFRAVWEHKSQWDMDQEPQEGMVPVPGDYYMSGETFDALRYYPLMRGASYDLLSGSDLAMQDARQPVPAGSALY